LVAEWTIQRTKDEVFRAAQAVRVPAFPVNAMDGVFASEQLGSRSFFHEVEHPAAGRLPYPTAPYRFSGNGWGLRGPAPLLGEHNQGVLWGLLGDSRREVADPGRMGIV